MSNVRPKQREHLYFSRKMLDFSSILDNWKVFGGSVTVKKEISGFFNFIFILLREGVF